MTPLRVALVVLLATSGAAAAPDLDAARRLGPITLYPDHEAPEIYYYAPGSLELATDAAGKPDLHFVQLRHTGTQAYGSAGERGFESTLTFRLRMSGPDASDLERIRRTARKLAGRVGVELRPLPIARFDTVLNYAAVDGPAALTGGYAEADATAGGLSGRDGYWTERVYTLPMDPDTSQLLWTLLREGQAPISLGYAFVAVGVGAARAEMRISETGMEQTAGEEALARIGALPSGEDRPGLDVPQVEPEVRPRQERAVVTGAVPLRVDAERWPDLFQRIDFNERAPPGYAVLRVYCYDFRDGLSADLMFKRVDFEAEAVGGRTIPVSARFLASQPDLYAQSIRFPIAIRMDRPFRYRVVSARRDGTKEAGPWEERTEWAPIVDVTSRPDVPEGETAP